MKARGTTSKQRLILVHFQSYIVLHPFHLFYSSALSVKLSLRPPPRMTSHLDSR